MARVSPATPEQFAQVADIMERWQRTKGYPPNSWLTMVRRPGVFRAYRALHTAVMIEDNAAAFAQKHLAPSGWSPGAHADNSKEVVSK